MLVGKVDLVNRDRVFAPPPRALRVLEVYARRDGWVELDLVSARDSTVVTPWIMADNWVYTRLPAVARGHFEPATIKRGVFLADSMVAHPMEIDPMGLRLLRNSWSGRTLFETPRAKYGPWGRSGSAFRVSISEVDPRPSIWTGTPIVQMGFGGSLDMGEVSLDLLAEGAAVSIPKFRQIMAILDSAAKLATRFSQTPIPIAVTGPAADLVASPARPERFMTMPQVPAALARHEAFVLLDGVVDTAGKWTPTNRVDARGSDSTFASLAHEKLVEWQFIPALIARDQFVPQNIRILFWFPGASVNYDAAVQRALNEQADLLVVTKQPIPGFDPFGRKGLE